MTNAKHTAGPWKAAPFSSVVGCPISAQPDPKRNTVIVAGAHGAFGDDYQAEVEANARLIAAAPELLEAAEVALKWLMTCDDPRSDKALRITEAAIAKAKGDNQ